MPDPMWPVDELHGPLLLPGPVCEPAPPGGLCNTHQTCDFVTAIIRDLQDEIKRLRDMIDERNAQYAQLKEVNLVLVKELPRLKTDRENLKQRIPELEKQNAHLRHLLEPFAHQARIIDGNDLADGYGPEESFAMFRFRNSYAAICLGDCRRALEGLKDAAS